MIKFLGVLLVVGLGSAVSGCGLDCALGLCRGGVAEGEGEFGETSICDEDGACFVCSDATSFDLTPNGAGCDGQIVCDDVEFRVDCGLDPEGNEVCSCEIDRAVQKTFTPTELCEAPNSGARSRTECGWTIVTNG